jgi:hypothetical protein
LFLALVLLISGSLVFSQSPFEGKVTHKLNDESKAKSGNIEIYYGKQKLKGILVSNDTNETGKDDLLMDFSKGLVYHINTREKTYRFDSINNKHSENLPPLFASKSNNKTILGHHSSAYSTMDTAKTDMAGDFKMMFWYADSLSFPVDEKNMNSDLIAFTNGKTICMGMFMQLDLGDGAKGFEIKPVLIEPMHLPESVFEIPGDYTLEIVQPPMADTAAQYEAPMPSKPKMNKAAKTINKKKLPEKPKNEKLPVKSPANKRKE